MRSRTLLEPLRWPISLARSLTNAESSVRVQSFKPLSQARARLNGSLCFDLGLVTRSLSNREQEDTQDAASLRRG